MLRQPIGQTGRTATFVIASSTASDRVKYQADYVCDGTADDVEIQAALDALSAGGCVYLTEGTYTIASDILPDDNQTLYSNGGAILTLVAGATTQNVITISGKSEITLRGLIIDGNGSNVGSITNLEQQRDCIFIAESTDVVVDRCTIRNCFQNGIFIGKEAERITVTDCWINENNTGILVYYTDIGGATGTPATDVTIHGNTFTDNGQFVNTPKPSLYLSGGVNYISVKNNQFTGGDYGVIIAGNTTTSCDVRDNTFRRHGTSAIWSSSANATHCVTIQNNTIEHSVGGSARAIYFSGGANYVTIDGNEIRGSIGTAIDIAGSDYFSIQNNIILVGSNTGILINGGTYNRISGNHIESCANSGITLSSGNYNIISDNTLINNTGYGVYLGSGVVGTIIVDNELTGNSSGQIYPRVGNYVYNNVGYVMPGEPRYAYGTLTAGVANAICFAWNNPEAQDILIKKVVVEVTTGGGTVGSHLDVGIADDAAGTNRGTEFFDDLLLNNAQVDDSWVAGDGGTQTKWVLCEDQAAAADDWIVGQILDANAASLVGRYYIEYVGR